MSFLKHTINLTPQTSVTWMKRSRIQDFSETPEIPLRFIQATKLHFTGF